MQHRLSRFSALFWEKCCLFTAYLHILAIFTEIILHMSLILICTAGLQCNINLDAFHKEYISVVKLLHGVMFGVHGFSDFLVPYYSVGENIKYSLNEKLCCYGILHLPLLDTFIILVNFIWYKLALSFYNSVIKKDIRRMQLFLNLATIKLLMEQAYKVMRHGYLEHVFDIDLSWNSGQMNFFLYICLMTSVYCYTKFLQNRTAKPAATIIKVQSTISAKIDETPEQPIAEKKGEKPPADALV